MAYLVSTSESLIHCQNRGSLPHIIFRALAGTLHVAGHALSDDIEEPSYRLNINFIKKT
jgi:hypothetical protein